MKHSWKTGIAFGLTSGVITTLGLVVGLYSSTGSRLAVIGGVVVIALADSLSDAMGIHISEESEGQHTEKEIWEATLATLTAKFVVAGSFVAPLMLFDLKSAVLVSLIWGFLLIGVFSWYIARESPSPTWRVVSEHFAITSLVIVATHLIGGRIEAWIGGP